MHPATTRGFPSAARACILWSIFRSVVLITVQVTITFASASAGVGAIPWPRETSACCIRRASP